MLLTKKDLKATEFQDSIRRLIYGSTWDSILLSIDNSNWIPIEDYIEAPIGDTIWDSVYPSILRTLRNATH